MTKEGIKYSLVEHIGRYQLEIKWSDFLLHWDISDFYDEENICISIEIDEFEDQLDISFYSFEHGNIYDSSIIDWKENIEDIQKKFVKYISTSSIESIFNLLDLKVKNGPRSR